MHKLYPVVSAHERIYKFQKIGIHANHEHMRSGLFSHLWLSTNRGLPNMLQPWIVVTKQ